MLSVDNLNCSLLLSPQRRYLCAIFYLILGKNIKKFDKNKNITKEVKNLLTLLIVSVNIIVTDFLLSSSLLVPRIS
jgi:hypothetical protein